MQVVGLRRLLSGLLVAAAICRLHERGVRPVERLKKFAAELPWAGKVMLAMLAAAGIRAYEKPPGGMRGAASASVSTAVPRPTLTNIAVGFIRARVFLLITL